MRRIAMAAAVGVALVAVLGVVKSAHAESTIRDRIDARGISVPAESDFPRIESGSGLSWSAHKPVNASLNEGERMDSLGRVVPSRTNSPGTGDAKTIGSRATGKPTGAAGYSPLETSTWHPSATPFSVGGR